jgi:phosphotransferase system enzyme I (PtsI)
MDIVREQRRYDRAVREVRDELGELSESVRHSAAAELAPFVKVHLMLLDDAAFTEAPRDIIREQHCNAEWALRIQLDELMAQFSDIDDLYLREREADVRQVAERIPRARSPARSGASGEARCARTRRSWWRATFRPRT